MNHTIRLTMTMSKADAIAIAGELAVLKHIQTQASSLTGVNHALRAYDAFNRAFDAAAVSIDPRSDEQSHERNTP